MNGHITYLVCTLDVTFSGCKIIATNPSCLPCLLHTPEYITSKKKGILKVCLWTFLWLLYCLRLKTFYVFNFHSQCAKTFSTSEVAMVIPNLTRVFRPVHILLSRFYLNLSWFYPNFMQIKSEYTAYLKNLDNVWKKYFFQHYPTSIQILSRFFQKFG